MEMGGLKRPEDRDIASMLRQSPSGSYEGEATVERDGTDSDNNYFLQYLVMIVPDEVLCHIFQKFSGIRDLILVSLVCKRWYFISRLMWPWRVQASRRWPSLPRQVLLESRREWFESVDHVPYVVLYDFLLTDTTLPSRYYSQRHLIEAKADEMQVVIEDGGGQCPLTFMDDRLCRSNARVLDSRICTVCGKLVLKVENEHAARILIADGVLVESDISSCDFRRPCAFHVHKQPSATLDWGFSEWYFGLVPREHAKTLLSGGDDGTFLIRESINRVDEYSVSVIARGQVHHIRIVQSKLGYHLAIAYAFPSIPQLVCFYHKNSMGLHFDEAPVRLLRCPYKMHPCVRAMVSPPAQPQPVPKVPGTPLNEYQSYLMASVKKYYAIANFIEAVQLARFNRTPFPADLARELVQHGALACEQDAYRIVEQVVANRM